MTSANPAESRFLVADVGGTNTRVALADGAALLPETIERYRTAEHPGIETVLRRYMESAGVVDCRGVCVAVAGPVRDGKGELTNLDWTIDSETLARSCRTETVSILNDLQAQGHAIGRIPSEHLVEIIPTPDRAGAHAAKLVIGVGTGFNIAPVHETAAGRMVFPSEAGHANMPIRTEAELRLLKYVETAHGFPSVEDVLSGRGLERIYGWLGREAGDPRELGANEIMKGVDGRLDPRAEKAAAVFVRILGTVAGNLSLIHLPFGGVYLVGGVCRAFLPHLKRLGFDAAFRDKGRFAGFMGNFGVQAVTDDYAALTGSASHLAALR